MDLIRTRAGNAALDRRQQSRRPLPIPAEAGGDKASAVYENVQVLGDLSAEQFNRLMVSITEWVAPQQGCTYCHSTENMASDELYQKRVARRMLQMTQYINASWKENHVHEAGVTCYTCHRGNPVPANIWFDHPVQGAGRFVPRNNSQNLASRGGRQHLAALRRLPGLLPVQGHVRGRGPRQRDDGSAGNEGQADPGRGEDLRDHDQHVAIARV